MIPFLHGALGVAGAASSDFELIETQTVGAGGATAVTFNSIPQTYKHLQIRGIVKPASSGSGLLMRPNSDSTFTNYAGHYIEGNGSTAYSGAVTSNSAITGFYLGYPQGTAQFTGLLVDVLDYANTTKNKTSRSMYGTDLNGSGAVAIYSGLWMSTSAISSLSILLQSQNLAQYSSFSLYGVK